MYLYISKDKKVARHTSYDDFQKWSLSFLLYYEPTTLIYVFAGRLVVQ